MSASLYNAVDETLRRHDCDISAAECHGILCGLLCGRSRDVSAWLAHTFGYQDEFDSQELAGDEVLSQLYRDTDRAFSSDDFTLELFMPDDDDPLSERADALGGWCRGFLSGFGLSETGRFVDSLSDDSQEYLRDLKEISRVAASDDGEQADEYAFMELQEYVRMGALLVHEEAQALGDARGASRAIH